MRLHRRRHERVVAGVAGGVADAVGVGDAFVRAAFVTLGAVWGIGIVLYLALWLLTLDTAEDLEPVRLPPERAAGLGLGFLGLLLLLGGVGWWPSAGLVLTVGALAFGTAALTDRSIPGPLAGLIDPNVKRPGRLRMVLGVVLLIGGLAMLSTSVGPILEVGPVLLAVALTGMGLLIGFGPWVARLARDLGEERRQRIRQEERGEMAAHLHDSVLQTLALIQRSDDPGRMAMLARQQESELREWLYGTAPLDGVDLVSTALRRTARRIESDHQVPVDVVTVGDRPLDERARALVSAAGEALANAAAHSGASRVSLFFEAEPDQLVIYVTDQGKGFDPSAVPAGRRGIADSVLARMERLGGRATVDSEPGEGTEVILRLPVEGS